MYIWRRLQKSVHETTAKIQLDRHFCDYAHLLKLSLCYPIANQTATRTGLTPECVQVLTTTHIANSQPPSEDLIGSIDR